MTELQNVKVYKPTRRVSNRAPRYPRSWKPFVPPRLSREGRRFMNETARAFARLMD